MIYGALADGVLLFHFAFIVFVVAGGALVLRWRWMAWLHVPSFLWGGVMELAGWICPLTPLELHLRALAGAGGYEVRFLEHYLLRLIYPGTLTPHHADRHRHRRPGPQRPHLRPPPAPDACAHPHCWARGEPADV